MRYNWAMLDSPYLRLMRLHQPGGILLLMWPCWWAVALASPPAPPSLTVLLLFALGAVLMRGAGCVLNDMIDRQLDAQVERTKIRPLASGELTVTQAQYFLLWLLCASFVVALMLGVIVIFWAVLALIPVAIYPWMKRISWWPQLFLGLTFNWGALMGWAAIRGEVELPALLLYAGGIFWTLGYDTIYAHQDKKDDARAGIKSTALRLGNRTKTVVLYWYAAAIIFWALAGYAAGGAAAFYVPLVIAAAHFFWQVRQVRLDSPDSCRYIFLSNAYYLGLIVFISCLISGKSLI